MEALVLKGPNELALEQRDIPKPGPEEVLIRVENATICHTDFFVIEGLYPNTKYPTVPGHEFAGVIEKCGERTTRLKPGDPVAVMAYEFCGVCKHCISGRQNGCFDMKGLPFDIEGCYQEYVVIKASSCHKIPDTVSFAEAAIVEAAANGCAVVDRARISSGDTVVVVGPGPIGLLALQFARLKNPASIILTGTRRERLDLGRTLGADHTVNVREEDPVEVVASLTNGEGADAVLFCGGDADAFITAQHLLGKYGRVVIEAVPASSDTRWQLIPFLYTAKALSVIGACGYTADQFRSTIQMIGLKRIDVQSLITHTFPLREYARAFRTSTERLEGAVKVQFQIGSGG